MVDARVFISMGTPYTECQARFRDHLETLLRDQCGVDPRIIGKNEYPDGSPLTKIKSVMAQCDGVIVVAYERKFIELGSEKRIGPAPVQLESKSYTTPWNHIESAMAFTMDIPLYIFCQKELTEEGLVESKLDWYVQKIEINESELQRSEVLQSLRGWINGRVIPRSKKPSFVRTIQGETKLSSMKPKEILGALAVLIATFSAGATFAKMFPNVF